jgi:hypothetical protein
LSRRRAWQAMRQEVRAMSVTTFGRARGVWSEADYMALPETSVKVELFDGELVMTPPPNIEHQDIVYALRSRLAGPARSAGLTSAR